MPKKIAVKKVIRSATAPSGGEDCGSPGGCGGRGGESSSSGEDGDGQDDDDGDEDEDWAAVNEGPVLARETAEALLARAKQEVAMFGGGGGGGSGGGRGAERFEGLSITHLICIRLKTVTNSKSTLKIMLHPTTRCFLPQCSSCALPLPSELSLALLLVF